MTAVPSGSAPVWVIPADDTGDEEVDVLSLAGQPVPDGGAWLRVTSAGPQPGDEMAGVLLPDRPVAWGGEVVVHVHQAGKLNGGTAAVIVQVWAVAGGSLVSIAGWDPVGVYRWPEILRDPVRFAMGALAELEQHGAGISAPGQVDVIRATGKRSEFPSLPTRVNAAG